MVRAMTLAVRSPWESTGIGPAEVGAVAAGGVADGEGCCAGVAVGRAGATLGPADARFDATDVDAAGLPTGALPSPVATLDEAGVTVAAALEPTGTTKATAAGAIVAAGRLPGSAAFALAATQNAARPASNRATRLRMLI